jgi:glucans biosynthesis protein C
MNPVMQLGVSTRGRGARPLPIEAVAAEEHLRQRPRYHALDALRGAAMFLVVTLHAALAYTRLDVPRLLWGAREPSTHLAVDLFCWWAMGVSLPLFFLIGGFFAAELYRSRGPYGFLRNRAERIAAPFFVACLTVLPASFLAWAAGWLVSGRCTPREVLRMKFHGNIQPELYGPGHLWFLEYLIVMLLVYLAVRVYCPSVARRAGGGFERLLQSPWRAFVLAIPTALILWLSRERVGLDAVLDRHNSFIPDPLRLLHHGLFFAVGACLNGCRAGLDRFRAPGVAYLAMSVPIFLVRAWFLRQDWERPLDLPSGVAMEALAALFAWLTVFGILGVALRANDRPRRAVKYLADSSYWVYLVHFPIIGLIQANLFGFPIPSALKFAVALGLTLALGLSSYQVMVRHTVIGRWLHGSRDARPTGGGLQGK